ncbi:MAG: ATP-binding protein [Candidatus Hydrogenedentes bacterium]|nr:ATP-binding protein [Candidatus Hydrogenedentota bacterium]
MFERLEVEALNRVNLFVGKNNAGKSAFLEAVYLYNSSISSQVLLELIEGRQEYWETREFESTRGLASNSPFRHLFRGHQVPGLSEAGIRFGLQKDLHVSEIKTAAYYYEESEDRHIWKRIPSDEVPDFDDDLIEITLVVESEGDVRRLNVDAVSIMRMRRHQGAFFHRTRRAPSSADDESGHSIFVPTGGISNARAARYWDMVNLTELEREVIEGLQVIEPNLTGIAFVESVADKAGSRSVASAQARLPLAKIQGISEPIPLKSLGDGITQVFHMVLAMVNAKGGTVLLDEFENGLHWSVQEDVWRIVFELAERLNIQVFATTHSRDCVESFRGAWSEAESSGAFFRLSKCGDDVEIKPYDLETLSDSIETSVEVR